MFKRISVEVDGAKVDQGEKSWEDLEPGNQYDTDQTFFEILVHNEKWDRLCDSANN